MSDSSIVHTGHKSIDQGLLGEKAAKELSAIFSECKGKLKLYRLATCRLPKVKNGNFGRGINNMEIHKFNCALNIADGLRGKFKNADVKIFDYTLDKADICLDDIDPSQSRIQNWCLLSKIIFQK